MLGYLACREAVFIGIFASLSRVIVSRAYVVSARHFVKLTEALQQNCHMFKIVYSLACCSGQVEGIQ